MKIATALVFLMTTLVSQAATSSCGPFPSNACPYKSLNRFMETTYKDDVLKNIDSLHYWPAANVYQALFDYTKAYHVIQNSVITGYLDKLQRFDYKSDKNEFLDDRAWLALAALRAYEIRPDSEFLNHALHTHSFMKKFWTFKCGGGVPWKVNNNYKNTITNALYLHLSAQLYRITKNRDYFKEAYRVLFWLKHSKLYDGSAFKDGLDGDTCKVNEGIYSYQIGEIVNGLVELYKASGGKDTMYLNQAKSYALNSLKTFTRQQVILEADKCDLDPSNPETCGVDGPLFKGIYVRGLGQLLKVTGTDGQMAPVWQALVKSWISLNTKGSIKEDGRLAFGLNWHGPSRRFDAPSQVIALDLMNALSAKAPLKKVCIYQAADYYGDTSCYRVEGYYDAPWNDQISSVLINQPGCSIILAKDGGGQGDKLTITKSSNYVGDDFNDKVSSFFVKC